MNSDSSTGKKQSDEPDEEALLAQREAAKAHAKERAERAWQRQQDAETRLGRNRDRSRPNIPAHWTPAYWWDALGGNTFLTVVFFGFSFGISAIFALFDVMRWPMYYLVRSLDVATGARSFPALPWAMWTLWGGLFGGTLGYWLLAPVYGNKENRGLLPLLPVLFMLLVAALLWAFFS